MAELGRPTVMNEYTLGKLEEGFLMALSDREACLYADINPSTLYDYCKEHPDFSERKELLKEQVKIRAKQNLTNAIKEGDKLLSQWWLERRDKDFNPKSETEMKGNFTIEVTNYKPDVQAPAEPIVDTSPQDKPSV